MGISSLSQANAEAATGLVLVAVSSFSAVASVSVDGCFSATYDDYLIRLNVAASNGGDYSTIRFRTSGSDNSASTYMSGTMGLRMIGAATGVDNVNGYTSSAIFGYVANASAVSLTVCNPYASAITTGTGTWSVLVSSGEAYQGTSGLAFNDTTSFDGFTVAPTTGTITGTLAIYGYKRA